MGVPELLSTQDRLPCDLTPAISFHPLATPQNWVEGGWHSLRRSCGAGTQPH